MKLDLKVNTTEEEIAKFITDEIALRLDRAVSGAILPIRLGVATLLDESIKASQEYHAIVGGRLQAELGLTSPNEAMEAIIAGLKSSMQLNFTGIRNGSGTLLIEISKDDFSDVMPAQPLGGTPIPWLDWLLTKGDSIVVSTHTISYKNTPDSRTGLAIMVKGGTYRIPPEYSGLPENNFITRSIQTIEAPLSRLIEFEIVRRI